MMEIHQPFHEEDAALLHRARQGLRIAHAGGQRFFAEHRLAGLCRGDHRLVVDMVRQPDIDRIHVCILQQHRDIAIGPGGAMSGGECGQPGRIAAHDRLDAGNRALRDRGGHGIGNKTRAQNAPA